MSRRRGRPAPTALPTIDAHDIEIRWPYAYVADGPGGLIVVDVRLPVKPRVIGGLAQ